MPTEEEQLVQEGKAASSFREQLMAGQLDEAKVTEREHALPPQAIASIVNSVFDTLIMQEERFLDAIELGKRYSLPKDRINDVIYLEFRSLINEGDVDKAIQWAMQNNLPDYEISRAALKGIENAITNQKIELAIQIKHDYNITEEQIGNTWQIGYDTAIQYGNFYDAALLSREFGVSERKTIITAAKAYRKALKTADFTKLGNIEREFRIFNDSHFSLLGDEDGRSLIKITEDFLREKLQSDHFRDAVKMIEEFGILYKNITNHTLRDLVHFVYTQAIHIHKMLLEVNRYDDAVWFKNELNLQEENTPDKIHREIFNQAVEYHNRILKQKSFSQAIKIKEDYELVGEYSNAESLDVIQNTVLEVLGNLIEKGETKAGNSIKKEYNIPQEEVEQIAKNVVVNALKAGDHDRAIDIVAKFNMDVKDFDIQAASKEAFDQSYQSGYFETAADLGYIFDIDIPEVKEAAATIWRDLMMRQEFRKALAVKKKHKLTKKHTEKIAKQEYERLLGEDDVEKAQRIRDDYRVNVSFFSWLIEFIKKILSIFFGGGSPKQVQPQQPELNEDIANGQEEEPAPQQ